MSSNYTELPYTTADSVPSMTSTERDAMSAVDGMMIYNTTTHKFQGHANGSWVDLN